METGDVEVLVHDITVLNTPERDLPFNIRSFNKVCVCGGGRGADLAAVRLLLHNQPGWCSEFVYRSLFISKLYSKALGLV